MWGDFHDALIQDIKNALLKVVPKRYLVRTDVREYVVLASVEGLETHAFLPDVNVTSSEAELVSNGEVAIAEPTTESEPYSVRAFIEQEFRENFVEVLDDEDEQRLVTCIEVLSPTNKKPNTTGWELYQRKRQGLLLAGGANLVELDLLRGGKSMPMIDPWRASPYRLLVARKRSSPVCRVWSAFSLQRLPTIPIPLLKPDPDVSLDFQGLIDAIYERCSYDRMIDYSKRLTPPLKADEAAWLQEQLQTKTATS